GIPDGSQHRAGLRADGVPRPPARAGRHPAGPFRGPLGPDRQVDSAVPLPPDRKAGPTPQLPDFAPERADAADAVPAVQAQIVVPDPQAMVALLGSRDQLLRLIEAELASDVHVRGNEITVTGGPADNAFALRVFEDLLAMVEGGQGLTADEVTRIVAMLKAGTTERPADVLSL